MIRLSPVLFALFLLALFLLAGCANSNVEVSATDQDAHQQLIEEEEGTNARLTERALVVEMPRETWLSVPFRYPPAQAED